MCSPAWAITDPPHAAHEEASSSTAVSRRRSATSSPTRSLTLRDVPRRIAWRVMIPKKISTMLSQLPLASPAVPENEDAILTGTGDTWLAAEDVSSFQRPGA